MHVRWLAIWLALAAATTSTALAQYPAGDSGPGAGEQGGMRHGRGMMGGGRVGGMSPLDPVVVEGPPPPAEFARITSVTDTQHYARLHDHFMISTRSQRDSLVGARAAMRDAFQDRDREAGRRQMNLVKSLGDDLSKQQETFDKAVKETLTKEAWKKYQDWRSDRRQEAQDHRRKMMGRRRGGGAPPESPPNDQ